MHSGDVSPHHIQAELHLPFANLTPNNKPSFKVEKYLPLKYIQVNITVIICTKSTIDIIFFKNKVVVKEIKLYCIFKKNTL